MHDYNHQVDYFDTTVTVPEAGGGGREQKRGSVEGGGGGCIGKKRAGVSSEQAHDTKVSRVSAAVASGGSSFHLVDKTLISQLLTNQSAFFFGNHHPFLFARADCHFPCFSPVSQPSALLSAFSRAETERALQRVERRRDTLTVSTISHDVRSTL